jgi:anti-sigma factor RsiW
MAHISDDDLERYYLGMLVEEPDLGCLEEHLLACSACAARAAEAQDYIDAVRAAIIAGGYDRQAA